MASIFGVRHFLVAAISIVLASHSVHAESAKQLTVCASQYSLLRPLFKFVFNENFYKLRDVEGMTSSDCSAENTCDVFVITKDFFGKGSAYSNVLKNSCNKTCSITSKTQEVFVIGSNPEMLLPSVRELFRGHQVNFKMVPLKDPYSIQEFEKKIKPAITNTATHRDQLQNQISKLAILEAERAQKEFTQASKANQKAAACTDPGSKSKQNTLPINPKLCDYFRLIENENLSLSSFLSAYLKNNSAESTLGLIQSGILWQGRDPNLSGVDKNHPLAKLFHSLLKSAKSMKDFHNILLDFEDLKILNQIISKAELSKLFSKFVENFSGSENIENACYVASSLQLDKGAFDFLKPSFLTKIENERLLTCFYERGNKIFIQKLLPFLEEKDSKIKNAALKIAAIGRPPESDDGIYILKQFLENLDIADPSLRGLLINRLNQASWYLKKQDVEEFYSQLYLNLVGDSDARKKAAAEVFVKLDSTTFNSLSDDLKNKLNSYFEAYKNSQDSEQKLLGFTFFKNRILEASKDIKELEALVQTILDDPKISDEQKLESFYFLDFSEFKNQDQFIDKIQRLYDRMASKINSSWYYSYQINKIYLSFSKQTPQLNAHFEKTLENPKDSVDLYNILSDSLGNPTVHYPEIANFLVKHRFKQLQKLPEEFKSNLALANLALRGALSVESMDSLAAKLRSSNLDEAKTAADILKFIYKAQFSFDGIGRRYVAFGSGDHWSYDKSLEKRASIFKALTKRFRDEPTENRIEILKVISMVLPPDFTSVNELIKIAQNPATTLEEKILIHKTLRETTSDVYRQIDHQRLYSGNNQKKVKSTAPVIYQLYTLLKSDKTEDNLLGLQILNSRPYPNSGSITLPTAFADLINDLKANADPLVSTLATNLNGNFTVSEKLDSDE